VEKSEVMKGRGANRQPKAVTEPSAKGALESSGEVLLTTSLMMAKLHNRRSKAGKAKPSILRWTAIEQGDRTAETSRRPSIDQFRTRAGQRSRMR